MILYIKSFLGNCWEMKKRISYKYRILRTCFLVCVVLLCCAMYKIEAGANNSIKYSNRVIFTAPSAEKIFDGTPLTEQIDVTVQGLPDGFTYKAVAEGSVTYPEDNKEDNNIITDYIIYDPSGLNVTDCFVNIETRPGTLRVSYPDAEVLGARRGDDEEKRNTSEINSDSDQIEQINEEEVPTADSADSAEYNEIMHHISIEVVMYSLLFIVMIVVFGIFLVDSNMVRVK